MLRRRETDTLPSASADLSQQAYGPDGTVRQP